MGHSLSLPLSQVIGTKLHLSLDARKPHFLLEGLHHLPKKQPNGFVLIDYGYIPDFPKLESNVRVLFYSYFGTITTALQSLARSQIKSFPTLRTKLYVL